MEQSDASSVSTASTPANLVEHNVWNPMMELLVHVQICGIFEIYIDEFDLARIALSCHFALEQLCDKADTHDSAERLTWHHCP